MLVDVGCVKQDNFNIDCYMSPSGASVPIQVTRCWIPTSGCTKQDLGIQEGHKHYFYMSHLH